MQIQKSLQNLVSTQQYALIMDFPGNRSLINKYFLDYASKNLAFVNLFLSYVAFKNGIVKTGNILLQDLIRLQEDIEWKFVEVNPFAITLKQIPIEELQRRLYEKTIAEKSKKEGTIASINRLKASSSSLDIQKKPNKRALLKQKSKEQIKKQDKKIEPELPRIKQSGQNKIKSLFEKKIQKKIEEPPKSTTMSLKVKFSTSDQEDNSQKMDIEEKEDDLDEYEKFLQKKNKSQTQQMMKKIEDSSKAPEKNIEKKNDAPKAQKSKAATGNRSMFDFMKKK